MLHIKVQLISLLFDGFNQLSGDIKKFHCKNTFSIFTINGQGFSYRVREYTKVLLVEFLKLNGSLFNGLAQMIFEIGYEAEALIGSIIKEKEEGKKQH